nr:ribosomal protein L16 [Blastocystis sp. subtype 8]
MYLKPKNIKQFKIHKGRLHGLNYKSKNLTKGNYGLKALDFTRLTSKQIETSFIAINRFLEKQARVYINVFPDISVTRKNIDARMGKGKGDIKFWVCAIKPGKIIFEIDDVDETIAFTALCYGASKLRIRTKIIKLKKFR